MKKTFIILILLMGIVLSVQAQYFVKNNQYYGGGLFGRGLVSDERYYGAFSYQQRLFDNDLPALPGHDLEDDQPAPIGSGALLLVAFGAAYAFTKKRKDER